MKRTQARPIPQGRISRRNATIYALAAGVRLVRDLLRPRQSARGVALAGRQSSTTSCIYTMWLKRITPLNIVVGGAAGSVPPLVGWAAVTHTIGAPALGLFALIFLWTPPHFWSLALMTETEYGKAKIPMFPNVYGDERTKREIVYYSLLLVAASLALYPLHVMGAFYFGAAAVLGGIFVLDAVRTWRERTGTLARAQALSLLAALSRAHVRRHGDRPHRLVNRLLWTLALGVFAGALDLSVLSPALPALGRDFGVQTGDLAWVFTIYLLVTVLSIALAEHACRSLRTPPGLSRLHRALCRRQRRRDRRAELRDLSRRRARFRRWVPAESSRSRRRRSATSCRRNGAVRRSAWSPQRGDSRRSSARASAASITHYVSWRWIFAANVPLAAVVFALALRDVPRDAPRRREPLDVVGLALALRGLARADGRIDCDALVIGVARGRRPRGIRVLGDAAPRADRSARRCCATPQLVKTYALEIVIGVLEGSLFFIPTVLVGAQGLSYAAAGFVAALGAFTFVVGDSGCRDARSTASAAATCCWSARCSPSSAWRFSRSGFNRSRSRCSR